MSLLMVRNVEPRVVVRLRMRAARNGVSVEEEHRRILQEALLGHQKFTHPPVTQHPVEPPKVKKEEPQI